MLSSTRFCFYAAIAGVFILLKLAYLHLDSPALQFLLAPTNVLVGTALNSPSYFSATSGYVHEALHFTIEKSCSGYNFWLMCWVLLAVEWGRHKSGSWRSVGALLALLFLSYGLTVLVNAARILTAVQVRAILPADSQSLWWLHETEGVLIYLFFLVIIYSCFSYLFARQDTAYAHAV